MVLPPPRVPALAYPSLSAWAQARLAFASSALTLPSNPENEARTRPLITTHGVGVHHKQSFITYARADGQGRAETRC